MYARTTCSLRRPKVFRELFDLKHFLFKARADSEIYLNEICHLFLWRNILETVQLESQMKVFFLSTNVCINLSLT